MPTHPFHLVCTSRGLKDFTQYRLFGFEPLYNEVIPKDVTVHIYLSDYTIMPILKANK